MDEKPVGKWSFHVTALQEIAETKPENLRFWYYSTSCLQESTWGLLPPSYIATCQEPSKPELVFLFHQEYDHNSMK